MIKLSLTKDKMISLIKLIQAMILQVKRLANERDLVLQMELHVHILNLQELQDKLSVKYIQRRHYPAAKNIHVSLNPNQAFAIFKYRMLVNAEGYELLVSEEITPVITQFLLQ